MNVLFLTLANINIQNKGIYSDLARCFTSHGHTLYIVSPIERRNKKPTHLDSEHNMHHLHVRSLNIQKTNIIEKGLATLMLETQFCRAIKAYFKDIHFDIILYSTPPITFAKVIRMVKKTNPTAISYLLLKDIFPQNAVDLGMFGKSSIVYKYFRHKEKQLYALSDFIGCMSPANVAYLLKHNPTIDKQRVEVAPNSIEIAPTPKKNADERKQILHRYGIPSDKIIFIYGGNLGKPQGIPFLIKCLEANMNRKDCHFIIVGNGTEYAKMLHWHTTNQPNNVTLLPFLPKDEYDQLVMASDIGLIFLDYHFTIPNFPSRILPYMQYCMPIIAATDPHTDIGLIVKENRFGLSCLSNDVNAFTICVDDILRVDHKQMGYEAYKYLCNNYSIEHTYNAIVTHLKKN